MSNRHAITVRTAADRQRLLAWAERTPIGWRVEFKESTRSMEQNSRLWAILQVVAKQGDINGQRFDTEAWKCIFMRAMGKEAKFYPSLDGSSFFPAGFRSSQLTIREMSDLQTFIEAWAADKGISLGRTGE